MDKTIALVLALLAVPSAEAMTLKEVVDTTIKTNPNILASSTEREAVSEEVKQAKAGYLPSIDVTVGTGFESSDNPSTRAANGHKSVHLNRDEARIEVRQMLFDGLATQNEVRRQTERANSKAYSVANTAENTALETVKVYLDVLRFQELASLAETNYEAHERTHDQISLRSERGVGRKADMDQSLGRLALAKSNLIAEQSNLKDTKITYLRVTGLEAEELTDPDINLEMLPQTLEEAISIALANHPTLKTAQFDLKSAEAQYDAAKSPFYPRVDFELDASANNDLDGTKGHNNDLSAMFRLRYNLLNGGQDIARREQTAHLINQASYLRDNTHREVEESMQLSWNSLQTVTNQMEYLQQHVEASEKSRDAYQLQFSLGQRTLLDLLDSENEVLSARQALVRAKYDQLYSIYRILNSSGLLLESLDIARPDTAITIN